MTLSKKVRYTEKAELEGLTIQYGPRFRLNVWNETKLTVVITWWDQLFGTWTCDGSTHEPQRNERRVILDPQDAAKSIQHGGRHEDWSQSRSRGQRRQSGILGQRLVNPKAGDAKSIPIVKRRMVSKCQGRWGGEWILRICFCLCANAILMYFYLFLIRT